MGNKLIIMLDKAKTEWGLYRANPDAQDNVLKLTDECSCEAAAACQDYSTGTVADARTVASITYDGVVYPTPTGALAKSGLQAFIQSIIDTKEVDGYVKVTYVGTTLTVTHVGEGTLSVITYDNASTTSLTRCCTLLSRYINEPLSVVGAVGPLEWGGDSVALDNTPYAHTGTLLDDNATAAELEEDLGTALTALGVPGYEVTVTNDTVNSKYIITLITASGDPVKIGDVYFEVASYGQEFICA